VPPPNYAGNVVKGHWTIPPHDDGRARAGPGRVF